MRAKRAKLFEVKGGCVAGVRRFDGVELMTLAVPLGGVETLIQHPASMTHAAMPRSERLDAGITDGPVRLLAGCEDVEDLIADLEQEVEHEEDLQSLNEDLDLMVWSGSR